MGTGPLGVLTACRVGAELDYRMRFCGPGHAAVPQKVPYVGHRTSGWAFPVVSFGYLSVECPSYKVYGINCRPKLAAKLLDCLFHRGWEVSPVDNNAMHRLFDGP